MKKVSLVTIFINYKTFFVALHTEVSADKILINKRLGLVWFVLFLLFFYMVICIPGYTDIFVTSQYSHSFLIIQKHSSNHFPLFSTFLPLVIRCHFPTHLLSATFHIFFCHDSFFFICSLPLLFLF